ncbi:DNA primase [Schaalia suimastitidis]|uniref:DNA primase n=1 Tax=Schaalia suimastitidis TaxID=121163 RepID=UPI00041274D8|nr:DNA primase [Schaalia suimastitidis]
MAGLIRKEDIAAVRDASRIDDIVGEHVALRTAGVGSQKGLCPFHDERTPSFHVRPLLGLWHCFGCGEGGDVISFVEKINHISFTEAVELLAARANITLHYEEGGRHRHTEEPGRRQRLLDAHRAAEEFYQLQLGSPQAHVGRAFLAGRGFTEAMCRHFGVGYAPQGWDNLTRHLRSRGFTDDELKIAGLASAGNRGLYDRFRGRLVWPIRDITGATVGFGARRLDDNDKESPKYLNTPETPIFKKSQLLYGLDLAKKAIISSRRIVVVEGYTDVMAAHVAGETCAVATCGTAFGSEHVKIVRRLLGDNADPAAGVVLADGRGHGGEVIFTFDGDEAGQKAALRAFTEDQNFAAQTFVAVEAHGMDPCDLRLAHGDQAVRRLVEGRIPLFEFVIRAQLKPLDLRSAEGRVRGLRLSAPVVSRIKDRALRTEYTRLLAGWLGMDIAEVSREVRYSPRPGPGALQHEVGAQPMAAAGLSRPRHVSAEDPVTRLERHALACVLQFPRESIGMGFEELDAQSFTAPTLRTVHDALRAVGGLDYYVTLMREEETTQGVGSAAHATAARRFVDAVRSFADPFAEAVSELVVTPLPIIDDEERIRHYCRGTIAAMVRKDLVRRIGDLRTQLHGMNDTDPAYTQVFAELMRLEARRQYFVEHPQ